MATQETQNINTQAYNYNIPPETTAPFWTGEDETEEINKNLTATASVSDTTGTPAVEVTKNGWNLDFAFSGLKGETGANGKDGTDGKDGENGTNGTDGISPTVTATGATGSGEIAGTIKGADGSIISVYNGARGEQGEAGKDGDAGVQGEPGASPTVVSNDTSESGAVAGTITGADGTIISVYNGAKGDKGDQGEPGPSGTATGAVTDVSITNTNGVYTVSQTKDGASADIGQIEVPSTDNLLAEVTDSVVENTNWGYDFHTIKETENNGTQNDVGKFYIARTQLTGINTDANTGAVNGFDTVNQSGDVEEDYNTSYNLTFRADTATQPIDTSFLSAQQVTVTGKLAGSQVTISTSTNTNSEYYFEKTQGAGQYATDSFTIKPVDYYTTKSVNVTIADGNSIYLQQKYETQYTLLDDATFGKTFYYALASDKYLRVINKTGWIVYKVTANNADNGTDCVYTITPVAVTFDFFAPQQYIIKKANKLAQFEVA